VTPPDTVTVFIDQLVEIHNKLEDLRQIAEDNRMPTAISMGLTWLRDDTIKVIADLNPNFIIPED